jgi:c-di-GMP-binding flagellar brake protein YcgR
VKLDNLPTVIKGMDAALHNIHNAMSANSGNIDKSKRRKFQRFENKHMHVHFHLKGKKEKYQATIFDVSAGGMRIHTEMCDIFKDGDEIEFEISKESNNQDASFLKGNGLMVRIDHLEDKMSIGVRFIEVAH